MNVVLTILNSYKSKEIDLLNEVLIDLLSLLNDELYIDFCELHPEYNYEFWQSLDVELKKLMINIIAEHIIKYCPLV